MIRFLKYIIRLILDFFKKSEYICIVVDGYVWALDDNLTIVIKK